MPLYEYHCTRCSSTYELLRPMQRSDEPGTCPQGHSGGTRTITTFAVTNAVSNTAVAGASTTPSGGGCACGGGGCGCAQ